MNRRSWTNDELARRVNRLNERTLPSLDRDGNTPGDAKALRRQIAACEELARRVNELNRKISEERQNFKTSEDDGGLA